MERFMQAALDEARKGIAKGAGGPFGAVVVYENRIVGSAHNEVVGSCDPTAHAEILAIRRAAKALGRFDLSGCVLYATGEPCPMCFSAIHWARIERVVYCNAKSVAAEAGFDDVWLTEILAGRRQSPVLFEYRPDGACVRAVRAWEASEKKVLY
ncbi:MAG: nucleoside deaminase [Epsilonproteobacteria bacterium]|nr:nucleoside deaminase [Campylobacterota bacterium]